MLVQKIDETKQFGDPNTLGSAGSQRPSADRRSDEHKDSATRQKDVEEKLGGTVEKSGEGSELVNILRDKSKSHVQSSKIKKAGSRD